MMKTRSGAFALSMGILMVFVWIVYIATGQYDYQTAPLEAISLLAAEALTALALIVGGIGVLVRQMWATAVHIASLGMMLYTSLNSIGVFAQAGVIPASIFFVVLTLTTTVVILAWARRALQ
jgi:hypothetical protein